MSYILDALKKSEQQRGNGKIPDVQTVHSSSLNYRDEKKAYWPYILIAAILLNLIAIIYFIFDKESDLENITTSAKTTATENNPEDIGAINTTKKPAPIKKINSIKTAENAHPPLREHGNDQPLATSSTPKENINTTAKSTTAIEKNRSPVVTPRKETTDDVVEYYDLPESLQLEIPTITVSAHIYSSNPLQRSIVINNKFLEEGDYVLDDLTLQEITVDGAIFDYRGTRFRYGVVSGWQ